MPLAAHLGYRSADTPLFACSAPSIQPRPQIEFAAKLGFAGMQCVFATGWSPAEQRAIGDTLRDFGMRAGCLLYAPFEVIRQPLMGTAEAASRARFMDQMKLAIDAAERIGSRQIAVLAAADPHVPIEAQRAIFRDRLCEAVELVRPRQIEVCLEALASPLLPPMLLQSLADAVALVEGVGSASVRLVFDTGHVQLQQGEVVKSFEKYHAYISILQLADMPGRFEPGSGRIDFVSLLRSAQRLGYRGLVELEHGWSTPGPEGEQLGLQRLRTLDDQLRGGAAT